ncbi:hypothetical protein MSAN_01501400 [Mycena sanguinolenta]|uniref:Uncharacterized protein n=1 Tax=Mycena sanguinolenta TaxID=230812 RepID=A0A8H7CWJ0_9AGAR|nr:hypothetical protein MSAN_01501400 [Mycena sanguinolenta]
MLAVEWAFLARGERWTRVNEHFDVTKRVHRVRDRRDHQRCDVADKWDAAIDGILMNDIHRLLPGSQRGSEQCHATKAARPSPRARRATLRGSYGRRREPRSDSSSHCKRVRAGRVLYILRDAVLRHCARGHVHRVRGGRDRRGQVIERILIKDIYHLLPEVSARAEGATRSSLRARRSAQLMYILASPAAAWSSTSEGEVGQQCGCNCSMANIAFTSRAINDAALRITIATPPAISPIARLRSTDDPEAAAY